MCRTTAIELSNLDIIVFVRQYSALSIVYITTIARSNQVRVDMASAEFYLVFVVQARWNIRYSRSRASRVHEEVGRLNRYNRGSARWSKRPQCTGRSFGSAQSQDTRPRVHTVRN